MKAIVGVDNDGLFKAALDLLGRLRFPNPEVELIHTAEPIAPYPNTGYLINSEVDDTLRNAAEALLEEASEYARGAGLEPIRHEYVIGAVTPTLISAADHTQADLIAIGSHQKSRYGAFFLGSVGRGLTIAAEQSVLISKGHVPRTGPLTAIFATDYSPYCKDAIRHFVLMMPGGLSKLFLVTAVTLDPTILGTAEHENPGRKHALDEGQKMIAELRAAGIDAEARVLNADVHECIEQQFREINADLVVMGAHGHGFFERLVLGSTSLREALATHHPILVVRRPSIAEKA